MSNTDMNKRTISLRSRTIEVKQVKSKKITISKHVNVLFMTPLNGKKTNKVKGIAKLKLIESTFNVDEGWYPGQVFEFVLLE